MRIVIDTNVVISAIFFGGKPRQFINLVMDGSIDAYLTAEIMLEYRDTFDYLCQKYPSRFDDQPLNMIIGAMKLIEARHTVRVCRDPDDDKFIECALDADCHYIISGDKDLLAIEAYDKTRILTVSEFLEAYKRISH